MGISVRRRSNRSGWWIFVRHAGERASQRFGTQEDAEAVAQAVRAEIATGRFDLAAMRARAEQARISGEDKPDLPTLRDYFARFERESLRLTVRPSTVGIYSNAFHNHILPAMISENPDLPDSPLRAFGEFHLDEITRGHVKALVALLVDKKCFRAVNAKTIAPDGTETTEKKTVEFNLARPSLRIILSALTTCLTNAQREDGLIPSNPALALGKFIKQVKPRHESIDPLTAEEVPVFLDAVRTVDPEFLCMFIVFIHTGIRSGECAGLQWGDVDFKNRYVVIQRTRTPSGRIEQPKNGKERKVDLSDAAITVLQAHRREFQKKYLRKGEPLPEWVFPNREGKPHSMTNVRNRIFHRTLEKAGLHRRPLHATRHTFATLLLMQGESPVYVKDQMGHSSIKVTVDVYGKWIPSANREAVNKLPALDVRSANVSSVSAGRPL